ncbi:hypothetical protein KTE17_21985 [Burkholderia gladioli]|uniref:hypothetical protein n=1 Tax=Burkholderia gladioli TaxID=28095 RepID=UPI001C243DB7|nr:hypothetical protein [Burkholderia gladioli]MBU9275735.1 hypothetical protein [Burkholderia gladioli]
MTKNNGDGSNNISSLITELSDEIDAEAMENLTDSERQLARVAKAILRLERDLTVPGSTASESSRVDRLMRFIEEEKF